MRKGTAWWAAFYFALGAGFVAVQMHAASITMEFDQPTYQPGDRAVLTITGDAQGDPVEWMIFTRVAWNPSILLEGVQNAEWPTFGSQQWTSRVLCQDGRLDSDYEDYVPGDRHRFVDVWAFDPPSPGATMDQPIVTKVWLTPTQLGDFTFFHPYSLAHTFFGEPVQQYMTTMHVVPEPGTGALLAFGAILLAWRKR